MCVWVYFGFENLSKDMYHVLVATQLLIFSTRNIYVHNSNVM